MLDILPSSLAFGAHKYLTHAHYRVYQIGAAHLVANCEFQTNADGRSQIPSHIMLWRPMAAARAIH